MKRIYNISIVAAIVCLLTVFPGCVADFGEINKNPNVPYEQDQSKSERILAFFPPMVNIIVLSQQNRSQHTEQMVGQYGGHLATSANWNGTNFANFNPQQDWIDIPWTDGFSQFYVNYMRVKELTESQGYIYHVANIIRVATQHKMADIYGPIPYSEASTGAITLKYDSVKDAYINMINDLNAAIEVLTEIVQDAPNSSVPFGPYDYVYHAESGSQLAKWVKYANSLKLRLAVRIAHKSETADFARISIEEAATHPIGPILVNGDNAINSSVPENETPGYYAATSWGDVRVNATLTTYMNAWNDPRTPKYMKTGTETTPDYTKNIGVRMGAVIGSNNLYFDFDMEPEKSPTTYAIMNVTNPEPVMLFCAAETHFLLAEAAVRGWYAGNAKELYETGIQRSLEQYGVAAGIEGYMSETMTAAEARYSDPRDTSTDFDIFDSFADLSSSSTLAVAWDAQDTDEKKIEAIITQKWIANYKLGVEAWSEWRRTGYPRIFPGANANLQRGVANPLTGIGINDVRMVRRLNYPTIEVNSNPEYCAEAVTMLGGEDSMTTELWWALGNR